MLEKPPTSPAPTAPSRNVGDALRDRGGRAHRARGTRATCVSVATQQAPSWGYNPDDPLNLCQRQEVFMGLLDDLLQGMAGQGQTSRDPAQSSRAGAGPGMNQVLMALMPIVLAMLSNRGGAGGAATPASRAAP